MSKSKKMHLQGLLITATIGYFGDGNVDRECRLYEYMNIEY